MHYTPRFLQCGLVAVDFFDSIPDDYGVEEEGITVSDEQGVEIPSTEAHVTAEVLSELQQSLNPLSDSENVYMSRHFKLLVHNNVN